MAWHSDQEVQTRDGHALMQVFKCEACDRLKACRVFLTRASLQTFRKVIPIAAIVLAMMQIIGTEKIGATTIVLDANGNNVEHHRS